MALSAPRIIYLSFPPKEIAGGIKLAFRHVEILCKIGIPAAIATTEPCSPSWFDDVTWVKIASMHEQAVATILSQAAVYLSLQRFDSVGMLALEAMASGAVVAGFTGIGGREYASSNNGFWAQEDDIEACVEQLATAASLVRTGGAAYTDMLQYAYQTSRFYALERLAQRLAELWGPTYEHAKAETRGTED
ncbi:MAG: hypothetical protein HOI95_15400 [Chromatiales bacterium]|jgi:glycosyltransferase involved in cell wall biosynthesis|nr:hypothetical protein [Chromatiales bacterium]